MGCLLKSCAPRAPPPLPQVWQRFGRRAEADLNYKAWAYITFEGTMEDDGTEPDYSIVQWVRRIPREEALAAAFEEAVNLIINLMSAADKLNDLTAACQNMRPYVEVCVKAPDALATSKEVMQLIEIALVDEAHSEQVPKINATTQKIIDGEVGSRFAKALKLFPTGTELALKVANADTLIQQDLEPPLHAFRSLAPAISRGRPKRFQCGLGPFLARGIQDHIAKTLYDEVAPMMEWTPEDTCIHDCYVLRSEAYPNYTLAGQQKMAEAHSKVALAVARSSPQLLRQYERLIVKWRLQFQSAYDNLAKAVQDKFSNHVSLCSSKVTAFLEDFGG